MMKMWQEAYLETCCRSALHRLVLAGDVGRPAFPTDAGCLKRLQALGFARCREDGRYEATAPGSERHASEILRQGRR